MEVKYLWVQVVLFYLTWMASNYTLLSTAFKDPGVIPKQKERVALPRQTTAIGGRLFPTYNYKKAAQEFIAI